MFEENKKNIILLHLKYLISTAFKNCCILHMHVCVMTCIHTADNQLNAKPVAKQRDEFLVSQRGSTKGKQSTNARV